MGRALAGDSDGARGAANPQAGVLLGFPPARAAPNVAPWGPALGAVGVAPGGRTSCSDHFLLLTAICRLNSLCGAGGHGSLPCLHGGGWIRGIFPRATGSVRPVSA
eukprot:1319671-Pyramimonas_sp.AAC.1